MTIATVTIQLVQNYLLWTKTGIGAWHLRSDYSYILIAHSEVQSLCDGDILPILTCSCTYVLRGTLPCTHYTE